MTMNLLILATILCGATVLVGATFFVEFYAPPQVTNAVGQTVLSNYLFECVGVQGTRAITARRSACSLIGGFDRKVEIQLTANFYSVYRPNLQGHQIQLPGRAQLPGAIWNVGFLNNDMDHPNFADPDQQDFGFIRARVEAMGVDEIVPFDYIDGLSLYFAQSSVVNFARIPAMANAHLSVFTNVLSRITAGYGTINQQRNAAAATTLRNRLGLAISIGLRKMIDPCSVLRGPFEAYAPQYCATYCNFLNTAVQHFGATWIRCSSLQGGECVGVVCTCNVRINPLSGCQSTTSPMRLCNNVMRAKLNI